MQEYRYDEFGNRIYSREGSDEVRYYYNNLNQLIRTENGEYTVDYGYDKRKNMVKKAVDGVLHTVYTYDARNQMSLAENTEGKETRYFYNCLGKRIGQMGTDGKTDDVIDLTRDYNNLLMRWNNGSMQSFMWDVNVVSVSDKTGANYYLNDELGSPMRVTDSTGKTKSAYSFGEFGKMKEQRGSCVQPFGYTGYQYDNTANLYFAQARYYDPAIGRFVSEDTVKGNIIRPDTVNPYIYCLSNPLRFVDPDGNDPDDSFHNIFSTVSSFTESYKEVYELWNFYDLISVKEGVLTVLDSYTTGPSEKNTYFFNELEVGENYFYGDSKYTYNNNVRLGIKIGSLKLYNQISSEGKFYQGNNLSVDVGNTKYSIQKM